MPLTQILTEEPNGTTVSAPPGVTPVVVPMLEGDAPRYDAQTVQQILALARQMQTRHRETLTAEDVEVLGNEVGIEPPFLRRALAQIEAQGATPATETVPRRRTSAFDVSGRPMTRRQIALATVPAALYLLLSPFTFPLIPHGYAGLMQCYCIFLIVPAMLAFGLGSMSKNKRVGLMGGMLMGTAALLAILANDIFLHHPSSLHQLAFWIIMGFIFSGALLGIAGALARQGVRNVRGPRRRKRVAAQ